MDRKRIGLLNLQQICNYGANLMAYAMEITVGEIAPEAEVFTINYVPSEQLINNLSSNFINLKRQFGLKKSIEVHSKRFLRKAYCIIRYNAFTRFLKKILKRKTVTEQFNTPDKAETERRINFKDFSSSHLKLTQEYNNDDFLSNFFSAIIVGSDVVWKPQRLLSKNVNNAYFLKTEKNFKKIAYAASIGISDEKQLKRLSPFYKSMISHFDAISIRENSTTDYIQSLLPDRCICNCIDPTFLIPASDYEKIIASDIETTGHYIYAYILGDNPEAYSYINRLAQQKGLKIYFHSNYTFENGINTYSDGPCEFLQRIKNAEYVITDSFHGTAFSIIFKKQFYSFTRGVLSVRLENFMSQIGMKDRLLSSVSDETDIDSEIPYDDVFEKIDDWVKSSKEFLKEAIYQEDKNENCCNNANKTEQ